MSRKVAIRRTRPASKTSVAAWPPSADLEIPQDLPIAAHAQDIADAIRQHQTLIVCGETGSGKTTQLPKICLAAGRGRQGKIGHTQPRRIAARAVASRIAEEVGPHGKAHVGHKVRFEDRTSAQTVLQVMTDGILLAELSRDPELKAYDTVILDEAHERSLNIDFLLGYLHRLLPRRPDLRLIITSATLETERFSEHFGGAPVFQIVGRSYPVDIRWQPPRDGDLLDDLPGAVLRAVSELHRDAPGDILIFLSGEGEITECKSVLGRHGPANIEVLPLYARLSSADQARIFAPHSSRRVILATNIAETSLTVPGIRSVVDSGLARISRFDGRTNVQRLPIEEISQASAQQRSGRCGRLGPGICIRLYSEETFADRENHTPPEILRTNLAAVILQMKALRLGPVDEFPFLDQPPTRSINDGLGLLQEIGALDERQRLTSIGRILTRLPVDPRIGRLLIAGGVEGCLDAMLIVAAGLSIPDPRQRPASGKTTSSEAQDELANSRSDFIALLQLWNLFEVGRRDLKRSGLEERCKALRISLPRMWEWRDVRRQLASICKETRGLENPPRGPLEIDLEERLYKPLHRALLAGFPTHIANRSADGSAYDAPNGRQVHLFPGSGLFKKPPHWLVAAAFVETSRPYARTCGRIEPRWVEEVVPHLIKRESVEPEWDARRGCVTVRQRVSLGGLLLSATDRVPYTEEAPELCRRLMIDDGLAVGDFKTRGSFLQHNLELLAEVEGMEDKLRRRDLAVDSAAVAEFYEHRIPPAVADQQRFETWRRSAERRDPGILQMRLEDLLRREVDPLSGELFPDIWQQDDLSLPLVYRFEPGRSDDGVSIEVPLPVLPRLRQESLDWGVPGHLPDRVLALIKAMPKRYRKLFNPAVQTVDAFLRDDTQRQASLEDTLRSFLGRRAGRPLPDDLWAEAEIPAHCRIHIRVVDEDGQELGRGDHLPTVQAALGQVLDQAISAAPRDDAWHRTRLGSWRHDLPESIETSFQGHALLRYPTLIDRGEHVDLTLLDDFSLAQHSRRQGTARLLLIALADPCKLVLRELDSSPIALRWSTLQPPPWKESEFLPTPRSLSDEALLATALDALGERLPTDKQGFTVALERLRPVVVTGALEIATRFGDWLKTAEELRSRLSTVDDPEFGRDLEAQLAGLLFRGTLLATPKRHRQEIARYLRALGVRIDKARENLGRDAERRAEIAGFVEDLASRLQAIQPEKFRRKEFTQARFLVEELRISVFAQEVGTSVPASPKRVTKAWAEVDRPE